jgi:2-dehydropantoate 2-reductase
LLIALARELTEVAHAKGIEPLGFNGYDPSAFGPEGDADGIGTSFAAMVAHNRRSAKSHSGIWRDLAVRKRRTEVDPQLTAPIAEAEALGLPMPLTRRLIELIHDIEEGRRPLAWATLDALKESHGS